MRPLVEAEYKKYHKEIKFVVVDVTDKNGSKLADEMQVYGIPNMFFIDKNGQMIDSFTGKLSIEDLELKFQKIIK